MCWCWPRLGPAGGGEWIRGGVTGGGRGAVGASSSGASSSPSRKGARPGGTPAGIKGVLIPDHITGYDGVWVIEDPCLVIWIANKSAD
jgi:hypothetical protein